MARGQEWWDQWFIEMAKHVASASKDPSTKTGAVIVDEKRRIVSMGYNGFARGVDDRPDRYENRGLKYSMIIHAEINAVLFASRRLDGHTMFTWPFAPCAACAAAAIQAGISRCVSPLLPEHLAARWGESTALAARMFEEAGVELRLTELLASGE